MLLIYLLFPLLTFSLFNITLTYSVPRGIEVEWIKFPSHLGWPKEFALSHTTSILQSVPFQNDVKIAYVILYGSTNSISVPDLPVYIPNINKINVTFGWWGPQWDLGFGFKG